MKLNRIGVVSALAVAASMANAQYFVNNLTVSASANVSSGLVSNATGNSVTVGTPGAVVGDSVPGPRVGQIFITYDAQPLGGPSSTALFGGISLNIRGFAFGNASVTVTEEVFELNQANNEIGGPLTSFTRTYTNGNFLDFATITVNRVAYGLRIKKTVFLEALPDAPTGLDLAGVSYINQAVVPEPATMTALALGVGALLRRRRSAK